MEQQSMGSNGNVCRCPHHKVVPMLIFVFGLLFLLGAVKVVSMDMVNIIWPILVMAGGLMKASKGKCKCC